VLLSIVREMITAGTCLIAATHDLLFVRDMAERIVTIEDGWLISDDAAVSE
jgi:ABC-type ATPase involved in cell division